MAKKPETREQWLLRAVDGLRKTFSAVGATVPARLRVSCGWPGTRGEHKRGRTVGVCYHATMSTDDSVEIFVSPVVDDPLVIVATLVHELVHACLGPGHGHKGKYVELAKLVGLVKPWKSCLPGPELLAEKIVPLVKKLGTYPHASIDDKLAEDEPKKQKGRMLKAECVGCGYVIRTTAKWIAVGLPTCCCGDAFVADEPSEEQA